MSENLKSGAITSMDAVPQINATGGEGAPGELRALTDYVLNTTSIAQWSTYRVARFPTNAKVKRVQGYCQNLEGSSSVLATFDVNVAFSDDTNDATPVSLQGTIPSNKKDGTSFGFVLNTGYSTSYQNSGTGNKLFGTLSATASSGQTYKDITYNGAVVSNVPIFAPANANDNMWDVLGFTNSQGVAQDPGGLFDLLVVCTVAPGLAQAGIIGMEIDFIV